MRSARAVLLPVLLLLGGVTMRLEAQAALLFGYQLHAGDEPRFYEGYGQHLQWHRVHEDSLIWYGWQVLTGERLGMFIDGTFGRPFLAIDRRVDPAGDAADFAATAAPFADAVFREGYALRPELSTGTPLEDGRPTPMLEVIAYRVRPGGQERFEIAARHAREAAAGSPDLPQLTWYEKVNGGQLGQYLLVVHRNGFAGWDAGRADLSFLARSVTDARERTALAAILAEVVIDVRSELWRYLPGSSLIPER
jgi:hypothetical protein